ncbi:RidA family protein [Microvirga massiliensis]|uniref:RidA family protein n=1 Tax=Microvirga massiliensis TaxID=1033741 RepID=UPI000660FFE8|nr:RidA family protein [Microvirga massiliensis]
MTTRSNAVAFATEEKCGLIFATGVRAGDWIFLNGIIPRDLGDQSRPLTGRPIPLEQAESVWEQTVDLLGRAQSDVSRIVRADQVFADWRAVPFFHSTRLAMCRAYVAPSTSVLVPEMLVPGALLTADFIAFSDLETHFQPIRPEGLDIPATSSFAPVVKAGPLVFVAGFMAAHGRGDLGGIAPDAKVPTGHLWKGNRIELETRYLIREKLVPALAGAGLSLSDVVKANVYLSDITDLPAFNGIWNEVFGGRMPATTVTPTSQPGFAIAEASLEINLVAASNPAEVERIETDRARMATCSGYPAAVRAGGLLHLSGLVAADAGGLVDVARIDNRDRYLASSVEAQMDYLLDLIEEICAAAGTSVRNVVRMTLAHIDLCEFLPAMRVWERRYPGLPLPASAIRVPGPLMVPGCSVQVDVWVYAP